MANSFKDYPADGSQTIYPMEKPYLDRSHVYALVDGEAVSFTFVNGTSVSIVPAPANGTIVRTGRTTPSAALVDFQDGEALEEDDLDRVSLQALYLQEETADGLGDVLQRDDDTKWDAQSFVIKNVADPVDPQDAASKTFVETAGTSAAAQAISAASSAAASQAIATTKAAEAAQSETAAAISAGQADDDANSAMASSVVAVGAMEDAEDARDIAVAARDTAVAAASGASGSEANAAASAAAAATSETEAETAATNAETSLNDLVSQLIPIGCVLDHSLPTPPPGWIVADGSPVTSTYPTYRQMLVDAGSPYGTDGTDPLCPDYIDLFRKGHAGGSGFGAEEAAVTPEVSNQGWGRVGGALGTVTSGRLVVGSGSVEGRENLESLRNSAGPLQPDATGLQPACVTSLPIIRAA